jgi:peptide deformylase
MALLEILRYPDSRLHKVARPVPVVDDRVRAILRNLAETMYAAPGIGLAATQCDIHERIIVIDVTDSRDGLICLVNPQIVVTSSQTKAWEEGCLSVPGVYDEVERPEQVAVRAQNEAGEWFSLEADGLLAVCLQHEIDHLDGRVFVQHLSRLKQTRIRSKLLKAEREVAGV